MLTFTSDPGDWVGQGLTRTYYLGDGNWSARGDSQHIVIRVENFTVTGSSWWWSLDFAPPKGGSLTVASYNSARRYPFQPDDLPGLSFGGTGRGCNTSTGRFVIKELRVSAGNVQRLSAEFEQSCDGQSAGLRGRVEIASEPWR